jgi:ribose 5-phosphate isomerase B
MIYIGADHQAKKTLSNIINYLDKLKIAYQVVHWPAESDDYPIIAKEVTSQVLKDSKSYGLLICGSGHGMTIAANRIKGIRAILPSSPFSAELGRSDDNANILVLSANSHLTGNIIKKRIIKKFFKTKFKKAKRYKKRLSMLDLD